MILDTTNWKFFKFDKIFNIKKGFYNKKPETNGNGKIPFIGSSDKNHGITGYYSLEEIENSSKTGDGKNAPLKDKLFSPHAVCVTNNGSVGYAYYMDRKFTCSHDVNPLYLKDGEFDKYTGIFIATIIMNERYRWGYGRKWRPIRMKNSKIKLPVVMNNNNPVVDIKKKYSQDGYIPDWNFMRSYIKSLNYKIPQTHNTFSNDFSLNINENKWKNFYLSDLFDTQMGNGIDAVLTTNDNPKYAYVTRNRNNNGIVDFIDEIKDEKPFKAGNMTLALGGSYLGSCFVQNKDFYTAQNVGVLKPKENISLEAKIFISVIIRNECKIKYQAFGRELNSHFRKDFILKLPIITDKDNNPVIDIKKKYSQNGYIPDFDFMEQYIKQLPNGDILK